MRRIRLTEAEIEVWADEFWGRVNRVEPFPRSLESTILWSFPLAIVKLPRLGFSDIRNWLAQRDVSCRLTGPSRLLRACLVAKTGRGVIFLDDADSENDRRFSLVHEVVHFLCDYLDPRERTLAALGDAIVDVLDGRRRPTPAERFSGLLKGVALGTFTHLMDRTAEGDLNDAHVLSLEDRADRLAIELLAPRRTVLKRFENIGMVWDAPSAIQKGLDVLESEFGLPPVVGEPYARMLVVNQRQPRSFREWLAP